MRRATPYILLPAILLACSPAVHAQHQPAERTAEGVALTIYSSPKDAARNPQQVYNPRTGQYEVITPGYGIVKTWRKLPLTSGKNAVRITDIPKRIDATTVHFQSQTDPKGTRVLEQNFEYDLISADKILSKYQSRPISLQLAGDKSAAGTLLSYDAQQIVLETEGPEPVQIIQRQDNLKNIRFSALPGGLITDPTLVWQVEADKNGEQMVNVTYETGGLSWEADYTVVAGAGDTKVDLSGWVTINNQSGGSYKDAQLKLVAGDVHRASPDGSVAAPAASAAKAEMDRDNSRGFAEKRFFEYHLYTLGRSTTLLDSSVKQLELFDPVDGVPAKKIFLYYGGAGDFTYGGSPFLDRNFGIASNNKVDIYLRFQNAKKDGLGMPLPAGRVRVFKKDDADGSLELVGEDRIDHTPADEKVLLRLGSAFDLVGERKQTDFLEEGGNTIKESFEIRVRNHKAEDADVIVKENLYRWSNWQIIAKSHDFTKGDTRTIEFPVHVPKDGEVVVKYTVKYWW